MPRRSGPEATAHAVPAAAEGLPAGSADRLLRRLEWTVVRRLDGLLQGEYRTLMRGAGVDLADLREYQPHDDVRHIDWNVTARLGTPHVRVFSEDREMNAWFLLDLSPSVDFGPPGATKRDQLTGFVAVLARLLTRHGNRVGALLLGSASSSARSSAATALPPPPGSIGELKWDSGSGTYFGVDPKLDMIYIMLEQTQNERQRITPAFRKLVYDAFSPD